MKVRALLLLLTASLIAATLTGCLGKTYAFSFSLEQDLVNF